MSNPEPQYENNKYAHLRAQYLDGIQQITALGFTPAEYIEHFPAFTGHLTLARFLSLYEAYRMTLTVAGHIAEVGVALGDASLLFGKLTRLFEPASITLVHGFDWFQGARVTEEEKYVKDGACRVDEVVVRQLVKAQGLEGVVHIHNLDVTNELEAFFQKNAHLQFKLVFLDCGVYDVVAESIRQFWPRITPGGVLVLDHYSHEFAPGETRAIRELLPSAEFRQFQFGWMPVAYAVKR